MRMCAASVHAARLFDVRAANTSSIDDDDDVVERRRERGRDEAPVRVQQSRRQRGKSVEHHLGQEAQDENGGDVQLRGALGARTC